MKRSEERAQWLDKPHDDLAKGSPIRNHTNGFCCFPNLGRLGATPDCPSSKASLGQFEVESLGLGSQMMR